MWKLQRFIRSERKPESSSSAEVNFLDLCESSVRNIEDLAKRGHLLNLRQCQDLSAKVSKTIQNIRELSSYCGASIEIFRPALKNLYRYVLKAEALVTSCAEKEWCAAAVFQCQNENAFREILLDVSLCYSAIYEHAKSARDDWSDPPEDLRWSSVLAPTSRSVVDADSQDLQKRLDDHANGYTNSYPFRLVERWSGVQTRFLAKYLLMKMCHRPLESHASSLDVYSPVLWTKALEPWGTWGSSRFLGGGSGASGVCSTEWLGIPCAKKDFHEKGFDEVFLKEAGILAHLKHPCIVNFICCGNGSANGDRFIAMELMEKSLFDLIEDRKGVPFAPDVAIDMIVQMARGVRYLHDHGVAHRDLKPQNVVVKRLGLPHLEDHFCVKLVDFGISKMKVEASQLNTMTTQGIGTTRYRAPEANPGNGRKVDWLRADAYSFAITCVHLLSLETPFEGLTISELYKEVLKNARRPKLPNGYPEALMMLLKDCWKSNPRLRPSFLEICTRLETLKYRDASVNGAKGDLGVDSNYIKKKMEEHFSKESIRMVEVEDKTYHLQVAILPCTCGRAPSAFFESPYKPGSQYCNICWEDCHEEVYRCESCNFDAHPNCLEINEEVEVFFHHHPLHLLIKGYHKDKLDTTCYFCKESLQHSDWVYRCEQCDLDVHAFCTKYPKELMRRSEHDHPLNLVQHHSPRSLLSVCCNIEVRTNSWRYTCVEKSCNCDIHPNCITIPRHSMCVFDASHRFNLVRRPRGFFCSICGSLGYSWLYHCVACNLDVHVECLGDVERNEDHWSGAYEELIQESKTKDNRIKMDMVINFLEDVLLGSDSCEGGLILASSSTSVSEGSMRRKQPNIRRLVASQTLDLDAIDFVNAVLRKKIADETVKRKAKQMATKANKLECSRKYLEMLENVERMVLDLRSSESVSQGVSVMLDRGLARLKIRKRIVEDGMAMLGQSKMRNGPCTCLFYQRDNDFNTTVLRLLTSIPNDIKGMKMLFLCEEPNHQHIIEDCSVWDFDRVKREEVLNLQALFRVGLKVVARIVIALPRQLSGLHYVTLPNLGSHIWELKAIGIEKHGKLLEEEENADVLKRAEDLATEQILSWFVKKGTNIFKTFGLLRVRYIETEQGKCPGYTRGLVAWLCKEHVDWGLKAGILESYPMKFYNMELN